MAKFQPITTACQSRWLGDVAFVACVLAGCSDPPAVATTTTAPVDADASAATADMGALDVGRADVQFSCPGGPGCACASHDECATTVCADDSQSLTGKACAFPFAGGCAPGFVPMTAIAGEGTSVCVPAAPKLCNPCEKDDDCKATGGSGALCVDYGATGRYCGVACSATGCPTGYLCKDATGSSGAKSKQCQPSEQSPPACPCSPAAAALHLTTPCQVVNGAGTCGGVRVCGPGGLSACSGKVPTPEACNGQDDDCNAQTDEGPLCDDGDACTLKDVCAAGTCKAGVPKACDDANDCTTNSCDAKGGECTYLPKVGALCSDGDPCTAGESCQAGVCKGGVAQPCPCATDADCKGQEDGNLCNGTLYCEPNAKKCAVNLATLVVCADDGKPCTDNQCVAQTGLCQVKNLPDSATCSDGLDWTVGDNCQAGACVPGVQTKLCNADADCAKFEDDNLCNGTLFCNKAAGVCQVNPTTLVYCPSGSDTPCAQNQCQPKTGKCAPTPVNELKGCEDGNPCTTGEACKAGVCTASGQGTCACTGDADCLKYEDGNLCNGKLYCDLAKQQCIVNPATLVTCTAVDDTVCSKAACIAATGKCAQKPVADGAPCDADGSACTPFDECTAGQCMADNDNVCQCQKDAQCDAWDDGNLCNGTLMCDKAANKCIVNPATVVQCPTVGNTTCSQNQCVAATGKCAFKALVGPCSDDNICTVADECANGSCLPGAATACDDGNPCTTATCKAAYGCVALPSTATCDADGDPCTAGDACKGAVCLPGSVTACDDDSPCTSDGCVPGKGCAFTPTSGPCVDDGSLCTSDNCADGKCAHLPVDSTACSDGNVCTSGDKCAAGACTASQSLACGDGNLCTDDSCDPVKGCVFAPNAAPCSDGAFCTVNDACKGGVCAPGAPFLCDDGNPCSGDLCDNSFGGCLNNPKQGACDDGDACTQGDACAFPTEAVCKGKAAVCDDGNACTDDACDKLKGCVALPNAVTCSDGDVCTVGDGCKGAVCLAGAASPCDDGNPCTTKGCIAGVGCTAGTPKSDGTACPIGACQGGVCEKVCDSSMLLVEETSGSTNPAVWPGANGFVLVGGFGGTIRGYSVAAGKPPVKLWTVPVEAPSDLKADFEVHRAAHIADQNTVYLVGRGKGAITDPFTYRFREISPATGQGITSWGPGGEMPGLTWWPGVGYVAYGQSGNNATVTAGNFDSGGDEWVYGLGIVGGDVVAVGATSATPSGVVSVFAKRFAKGSKIIWTLYDTTVVPERALAAADDGQGNAVILFYRHGVGLGLLTVGVNGTPLNKRMVGSWTPTSGFENGLFRQTPKGFAATDAPFSVDLAGQFSTGSGGFGLPNSFAQLPDGRWFYAAYSGIVDQKVTFAVANPLGFADCAKAGLCGNKTIADCDDGNLCTAVTCSPTKGCVAGAAFAACDDQNPCTLDTCEPKLGCTSTMLADGSPCGSSGVCTAGKCHLFASTASTGPVGQTNCALDGKGKPWCWGLNGSGAANQNLSLAVAGTPSEYPLGGAALTRISVGYGHNCGVTKPGGVVCWGAGGQLGVNGNAGAGQTGSPSLDQVVDVQVGENQTCALRQDQSLWCWGASAPKLPAKVDLPEPVSQVAQGPYSTCVLGKSGKTYCRTGYNPVGAYDQMSALPNAVHICNGGYFRCVVSAANAHAVHCYGSNDTGALGDAAVQNNTVASTLAFPQPITALHCSNFFACALDAAGQVWCWGENKGGECKVPASPKTPTPTLQTRIKGKVLQLHVGYEYITVRLADGSLWSWGRPYGLGNGGTSGAPENAVVVPVQVIEPTL